MIWRRLNEMAGIRHRSDKLLKEQDDLFGGGDDEGGDDEGGDEEGGDDMFAGSDEDAEEEEEEEEEEPAEELTPDELAEFGPGEIDQELDNIMANIFDTSMKSAQAKSQQSAGYPGATEEDIELEESLERRTMRILLEDEAADVVAASSEDFDMGRFCQEIARYISHYDTLIDMEGMIFNKAKQFILNNFNQETADLYMEKMAAEHGIDLAGNYVDTVEAPIAAGAGGEGGGGGGV